MNLLLSFGPLRAYIDQVRFISNRATGIFGYNLLQKALFRRYKVRAVVGPTRFTPPPGVESWIEVEQYQQLKQALEDNFGWADLVVMTAAVPDFVPARRLEGKIPREKGELSLKLKATPSIIGSLSKRKDRKGKLLLAVSLETQEVIERARKKLEKEKLDLILAFSLSKEESPYGSNPVSVALVFPHKVEKLPRWRKSKLAEYLLEEIERMYKDSCKEKLITD